MKKMVITLVLLLFTAQTFYGQDVKVKANVTLENLTANQAYKIMLDLREQYPDLKIAVGLQEPTGRSFTQRIKDYEETRAKAKASADSVFNHDCDKQFKEINEKLGKIFFELKWGKIYKAVKNIEYYH